MINFIKEVGKLVGGLLTEILSIPINGELTLGILLIIIILVGLTIRFLKGGKGD